MILTVFVSLLWPLAAQASAFGDQVADMAQRRAMPEAELRRLLAPNL